MDPLITSSLIGAGSQLLGGLFGKSSDSKNRALHRSQLKQAQGQFDQQMDHSIQRRVKDATSAGIHPLFALGGNVGASPTVNAGQPPQSGNSMGNAIANIGQIIGQIPTARAQIKRDEAEAAFLNAQAAKVTQDMTSTGRDSLGNPSGAGVRTFPLPDSEPMGKPLYFQPEIPKHAPGKPHLVSGTKPGFIEIKMPDGRTVENYDPDLGLDEIGQVNYVLERSRHKAADMMMWTDTKIRNWLKRQSDRIKKTKFQNPTNRRRY